MDVKLSNIIKFYEDSPEQREAIQMLQDAIPEELLEAGAAWHKKWLEHKDKEPVKPRNAWLEHQEKKRKELEELVPVEAPITPQLMHDITGYRASSFDDLFCDDFNRMLIDTEFSFHKEAEEMLIANILHETGGMIYFKELASGQAYEGRRDLGNTRPGDGPRFKGAGCLQLTGRYNYSRLAEALGDERVMEGVNYVADAHPFTSAETWIEENDLLYVCLNEGFEACCIRINGGTRGLNDRYRWYNIVKKAMGY